MQSLRSFISSKNVYIHFSDTSKLYIFMFSNTIRTYVRSSEGQWAYWASYVVFLVTYLALACCKSVGRRFPMNLVLLGLLVMINVWEYFLFLGWFRFRRYLWVIWYYRLLSDLLGCLCILLLVSRLDGHDLGFLSDWLCFDRRWNNCICLFRSHPLFIPN